MEFQISTETIDNKIYCHSRVFVKWTPSVKRRYMAKVQEMAKQYDYPLVFCHIPLLDKKLNKFVKDLGFKLLVKKWSKLGFTAIYRMDTKCFK